jgi:hypothetical protein
MPDEVQSHRAVESAPYSRPLQPWSAAARGSRPPLTAGEAMRRKKVARLSEHHADIIVRESQESETTTYLAGYVINPLLGVLWSALTYVGYTLLRHFDVSKPVAGFAASLLVAIGYLSAKIWLRSRTPKSDPHDPEEHITSLRRRRSHAPTGK